MKNNRLVQYLVFMMILLSVNACNSREKEVVEKTLNFKDHQVYYEIRGEVDETIVFIHGWSSSIQSWKYQLDNFKDYKVIAIDLPGHGKSSKDIEKEYTIELLVNSVKEVLDNEKIEEATLFGHSMGFAICEVIAYKYPEIVKAVGSIDGAHFELPEDENGREEWVQYNRYFANSLTVEKGRDDFLNMLFVDDTPKILKEEAFDIVRQTPLEIGSAIVGSMENNMDYWEKRVMDTPCMAVHSPVYQLTDEYKEDFMKMYPNSIYHEIDNVSHFLMLERPYQINQLITDFLESIYL